MKKLFFIAALTLSCLVIAACGSGQGLDDFSNYSDDMYEFSREDEDINFEPNYTAATHEQEPTLASNTDFSLPNLVDERFELVSLIFRLAGRHPYTSRDTEYQRALDETFEKFKSHPAVEYTRWSLVFSFDAPFGLAVHLQKVGDEFVLVDNIDFLMNDSRWSRGDRITEFVRLLNDFYTDTNFGEFFQKHLSYFQEHTANFMEIYRNVNLNWFEQHGINPNNLRVIISPAGGAGGYGARVYGRVPEDNIVYAAILHLSDFDWFYNILIHEFAHSIGNPIAEQWYAENEEFRSWAHYSLDAVRQIVPAYNSSLIIAFEYVTRAYTILYFAENGGINLVQAFLYEISQGFHHIQEVYAMITEHEMIDLNNLTVGSILGIELYTTGEEPQSGLGAVQWYLVDLHDYELDIDAFTWSSYGNTMDTQTGDVVIQIFEGERRLHIDLGPGEFQGFGVRRYAIFLLPNS